jgi:hypothetical protein
MNRRQANPTDRSRSTMPHAPRALPTALLLALLTAALLAATLAMPASGQAATSTCPATFRVLHNDQIGKLELPKGNYRVTLLDDQLLTCSRASKLFAQFLQDYDGRLGGGWRVNASTATFSKPSGAGFSVKRVSQSSGSGGGTHPTGNATKCPTFRVLHNDRIGSVRFPQGTYQMTALGGLTCAKASSLFAEFLQKFEGDLPGRWRLEARTATFLRGSSGKGLQVNLWR